MSQPETHLVNPETYAADHGNCSNCGHRIVRGDDWTIHRALATCRDTTARAYVGA